MYIFQHINKVKNYFPLFCLFIFSLFFNIINENGLDIDGFQGINQILYFSINGRKFVLFFKVNG